MKTPDRLTIPCSVCGRDASQDEDALYRIAAPEGRSVDDAPREMHRAIAEGYSLEIICGKCQEER